jgi:hypothetical protein
MRFTVSPDDISALDKELDDLETKMVECRRYAASLPYFQKEFDRILAHRAEVFRAFANGGVLPPSPTVEESK